MKNHEKSTWNHEKPTLNDEKPLFSYFFPFFPYSLQNIFLKKSKVKIFLLARAIHREYFLLQCLKKEIATTKELDLRQLGKVIIFRDRQTNKTFLLYIDISYQSLQWRLTAVRVSLMLPEHRKGKWGQRNAKVAQ